MVGLSSSILTVIFILAASVCLFSILFLLYREKGAGHALLGFFFPAYPYIWGWVQGARLQIIDIMVFWTFATVASVAFPMIMGAVSMPSMVTTSNNVEFTASQSEVNSRGPISPGSQIQGRIEDLFGVDEYTLSASAGQTVSIFCEPGAGSDADPRLKVIDPNGRVVAEDDDSGGGFGAAIEKLTLPSAGVYRIQVDMWQTGAYRLQVQ
ncbi:MAG: PPC domain-containing protein [Anaerolineales bacterium]